MISRIKKIMFILAGSAVLAGCASIPPNVEDIASTSNPTDEIQKTEYMLNEARSQQIDILSPENFADATKSLEKAKAKKDSDSDNQEVLKYVSHSRAWLNEAKIKAEIARTTMKDITDARSGALSAGAPRFFEKDWQKVSKDLERVAIAIEKGNLGPAEKKGDELIRRFRDLEVRSVTMAFLGTTKDNINTAKRENAEKEAPRSFALAQEKYENAERIIKADPRFSRSIARAAQEALRESQHLLEVIRKVNAGNSEALVLTTERQQKTISNLRSEYSTTEEQLQSAQTEAERRRMELEKQREQLEKQTALMEKAQTLRNQLNPTEAEVFAENGKLKVRLKGLQFPSSQSSLGPKNQALLKKVQEALSEVNPSRVIVEGHTDSIGSAEINKSLSQQRAQNVESFLVSEGTLSSDKIQAIGKGYENPIGDNSTSSGRAQNRRIDLVIETE